MVDVIVLSHSPYRQPLGNYKYQLHTLTTCISEKINSISPARSIVTFAVFRISWFRGSIVGNKSTPCKFWQEGKCAKGEVFFAVSPNQRKTTGGVGGRSACGCLGILGLGGFHDVLSICFISFHSLFFF